ncbi:hypothetical protein HMPREF0388_1764 [Mobiluncus curtisii ATCC 51333]|uniref:Uncharacterized protein n=1 Tax=Mobiluncus curtisii ATCC 51333 TaxID=887326 RepID=E6M131_9ACTO|nr:hypothetical protein HMPREF0388_1764 [Mobiluncus curtisii ATCC 51333]
MRTREPFIKIAQRIYYRPKIGRLTPVERDAYFCSLCVAGETNRDGDFSLFTVTRLTGTDVDDLQGLIPSLWEPTPDEDIFTVHDWLDWNLSAEEREYRTFIYSMNGAKGGRPAKTQDGETNPEPNSFRDETNLDSKLKADGKQNESKTKAELRIKKKELRIKKKNQETNNNNNNLLRARARGKPKTTETTLPADWQPTENHEQKCLQLGISLSEAVEVFRDWAGDEKTSARWNQTFATGLNRWIPQEILKRHEARDAAAKLSRVMCPLPDDWIPNGQGENLAIQAGIRDITSAVQAFRDWTKAKAVLSADWDAQWRTALRWLPDAVNRGRGRNPADELDKAAAELTALLETRATQPAGRGTETGHRDDNPPSLLPVDPQTISPPETPQNNNNHNTQDFSEPPF